MRERPILLNAEMVRAVLDGRKTQTRRIMKIQPTASKTKEGDFWFPCKKMESMVHISDLIPGEHGAWPAHEFFSMSCPFGAVGDRLWVRENCFAEQGVGTSVDSGSKLVYYPADMASLKTSSEQENLWEKLWSYGKGIGGQVVPSIHMPRWASRITLEITGVRVERLWDITEEDAKAEGFTFDALRFKSGTREVSEMGHTAVYQFGGIWQSIYGEESWQANPWVWVIEFKRVEGEA